jgi:hypothetical protein
MVSPPVADKKNTRNGGTLRLDATFIRDQLSEEDPKPASLRRYAWDFPSCIASSIGNPKNVWKPPIFLDPGLGRFVSTRTNGLGTSVG